MPIVPSDKHPEACISRTLIPAGEPSLTELKAGQTLRILDLNFTAELLRVALIVAQCDVLDREGRCCRYRAQPISRQTHQHMDSRLRNARAFRSD